MSKKGENIYKRKDGRWEGRYKKGYKDNRSIQYGYIYGSSYVEVKNKLYYHKSQYDCSQSFPNCDDIITYNNWVFEWLSKQESYVKMSTHSSYLYKLNKYILPVLGNIYLNRLTNKDIQYLIDRLQHKGLKPSTIHVIYQLVNNTLKDAVLHGKINRTPCEFVVLPSKRKKHIHALTRSEQCKIEECAKACHPYQGLSILLALNAGLRIGEISALRWKDIDFENRVIKINKTFQRLSSNKTGRPKTELVLDSCKTESSKRIIPISRDLYQRLLEWKHMSPSEFVCSKREEPSEPRLITYHFHQICKKSNLTSVCFHQLRHTFATRCIECNGDVASVSKMLGHSSTQTTLDIYTDSFIETRRNVIEKMESLKL